MSQVIFFLESCLTFLFYFGQKRLRHWVVKSSVNVWQWDESASSSNLLLFKTDIFFHFPLQSLCIKSNLNHIQEKRQASEMLQAGIDELPYFPDYEFSHAIPNNKMYPQTKITKPKHKSAFLYLFQSIVTSSVTLCTTMDLQQCTHGCLRLEGEWLAITSSWIRSG